MIDSFADWHPAAGIKCWGQPHTRVYNAEIGQCTTLEMCLKGACCIRQSLQHQGILVLFTYFAGLVYPLEAVSFTSSQEHFV